MHKLSLALLLLLTLMACAPVTSPAEEPTPLATATPSPVSTPTKTPSEVPTSPVDQLAVYAARLSLANALAIQWDDTEVSSIENVEWPDGCLGVSLPDVMCTQAIVPGYRVLLNVGPVQYEMRTNADGSLIKWAGQPIVLSESSSEVLVWQSKDCTIFSAATTQASYGKCGDATLTAATSMLPPNLAIISAWAKRYKSFETETSTGTVTFTGTGASVATPSEQRMMAEWASLTYDVASSGRAGAAWGLAFAWSREGGIAGFCDNVGVYRNGLVISSPCGGSGVNYHLTASQLDQLYNLLDTFSSIDYEYKDPAVADAMTTRLTFAGSGAQTALEPDIAGINQFAAELAAQGEVRQTMPLEAVSVTAILDEYFEALNAGDYIKASKLYAGDTTQLEAWNPDIKNNLPQWLERACTQNGLQCLLPRSLTYRGLDARGGYQFYVEFNNPDGTLFRQGGDASGSVSNFVFSVMQDPVNKLWLVMDLPPYVP